MRNLTKTLAILSLLTPVVGYPLGIGDFKLHSALNQNLNAEIPLTLSAGENAADIKVSLAPAAKFDEAGVPWTYFLSKIKFQTVVNANGSVVIKVSSKEALKEPFLNLLVEVSWPKGSLYREFTVLIDPPSTYKTPVPIASPTAPSKPPVATAPMTAGKPPVVATAPMTAGKPPVVATAPMTAGKPPVVATAPMTAGKPPVVATAPMTAGKPPVVATAPMTAGKPPVVATAPMTTDKPLISAPETYSLKAGSSEQSKSLTTTHAQSVQPANVQHSAGSSYGPVHKKETLWSIAVKFSKERDASVEQTLMAIYQANPDAFNRNNVFGLTSGQTLQIPDREDIVKLSREEAVTAYNLQKKAWKNGVTLDRADAIATTTKASTVQPFAPTSEKASTPASPAVKILDNQPKEITAESLKIPETGKETAVSSTADTALLDKVAVLEKQLKATKKALANKEKQIDEIKSSQVAPAEITEPVVPVEVAKPEVAKPEVVKLETINPITPFESINSVTPLEAIKPTTPLEVINPAEVVKPVPPTPVDAVKPVPPTPVDAVKPVPPTPVDAVKPVPPTPVDAVKPVPPTPVDAVKPVSPTPVDAVKPVPPTPVDAVKPVPPTPVDAVKPVPPTPVDVVKPVPPTPVALPEPVEELDPYHLIVGGGGAAVLSLLGWMWWRRRKQAMETSIYPSSIVGANEVQGAGDSEGNLVDNWNTSDIQGGFGNEWNIANEWNINIDEDQNDIDPISEADVYLAYGRYQQAEELMRDAIKEQPGRDECKLKLLEIFYASENRDAFEAYVAELVGEGKKGDTEFWEKVVEMGSEICPDSVSFSSEANGSKTTGSSVFESDVISLAKEGAVFINGVENNILVDKKHDNKDHFESVSPIDDIEYEQLHKDDIKSFDFDDVALDNKAEVADVTAATPAPDNKDDFESFDFDDFALDNKAEVADVTAAAPVSDNKDDFESFDFDDFALDNKAEVADVTAAAPVSDNKDDFESFDFDDFALDNKAEVADVTAATPAPDNKDDFESFDFDDFALDNKAEVADVTAAAPVSDNKDDFESFDFDDFVLDNKAEVADVTAAAPVSDNKDDFESFDFDDFVLDNKAEVADVTAAAPVSDNKDDFESFDFDDFVLDNKAEVADVTAAAPVSDNKDDFESFDFDDFVLDNKAEVADVTNNAIDFDFDFDMPATALDGQNTNQQGNFGSPELTDMDELETKLDLARAYIDMGDEQAARDITEEVLEKGTAEQKKLAEAILDFLK